MYQTITSPHLHSLEDLPSSLRRLIQDLQAQPHLTPLEVQQFILAAEVSAQDLLPWATFDHPVMDSYGRRMIFDGGHFEVMAMSWQPGDMSAIHDHGGTQWGAVQCFGQAAHYIYEYKDQTLTAKESAPYQPGMIRPVNHQLIHQMGNLGTHPFLSLHVYGSPHVQGEITGDARIFDLWEGSIQYTDGGVFFDLPEELINRKEFGLKGDRKSTERHHQQMYQRLSQLLEHFPNHDCHAKYEALKKWLSV